MAFFGVTLEEINSIQPHPNADRLQLATCRNLAFQFVIAKDQFSINEKVLYFPIDSILPEDVCLKLNLTGKLAGSEKNRVKSIKLRDAISQGIVAKPSLFFESLENLDSEFITQFLGVTKFDPPPLLSGGANLLPLPRSLSIYDIEGAERNQNIIELLLDKDVVISEKIEGNNFSVTKESNTIKVNQRSYTIEEIPGSENLFWKTARDTGLINKLNQPVYSDITVYAEICGPGVPQSKIYNLKQPTLFIFDIKENGIFVDYNRFIEICSDLELGTSLKKAPILFTGKLSDYLKGNSIQGCSNGKSELFNTKREGIVIKSIIEQSVFGYGRLIIKQRSPEYLASTDN